MEIKRVRLSEIKIDTSLFQFRSDLNQERVNWLVANWKPEALDPLDVWVSPDKQKYLLAGHHRLAAMIERQDKSSPCRLHESISLEEAQTLALMSNANRLAYTSFEMSRCVDFFASRGKSYLEISEQLAISEGMAKKYHTLRHLLGTDWEVQTDKLDLLSRAFEVGNFAENYPLSPTEIQSLFKITTDHDLTANQIRQLLRDIRRQKIDKQVQAQGSLFNLAEFGDRTAKALKQRTHLDNCAAQTWWLYEMVSSERHHVFPEDLKLPLMKELRRIYAHCIGSEESEVIPVRATKKGRVIPVSYEKPPNHE